jgi:hypothetical protein
MIFKFMKKSKLSKDYLHVNELLIYYGQEAAQFCVQYGDQTLVLIFHIHQ